MLAIGISADFVGANQELQRLQQEVEALRLKDLQQEHHINVLTQQLRSVQAEPPKVWHSQPITVS